MFIKAETFDGEEVYINPEMFAVLKWHPDNRKQKAGIGILASGKEFFFKPSSFREILGALNVQADKTSVPQTSNL